MPRKYELVRYDGELPEPEGYWSVYPAEMAESYCGAPWVRATAYDARDVEPVIAALKETICDDVPCSRCDHLRAALKAFEDEEGSGG